MTAQAALARHRMTRAREALQEADLLASGGHSNTALNRVYDGDFKQATAEEVTKLRAEVERFLAACEGIVSTA